MLEETARRIRFGGPGFGGKTTAFALKCLFAEKLLRRILYVVDRIWNPRTSRQRHEQKARRQKSEHRGWHYGLLPRIGSHPALMQHGALRSVMPSIGSIEWQTLTILSIAPEVLGKI